MTFTFYVFTTVLIVSFYPSLQAEVQIKELRDKLQESILTNSFFQANFSDFNLLKINADEKNVGVEYVGQETTNNLELLFQKAVAGKNVSLLVLGGSSSLGADLGSLSRVQTYHVALTSWWNRVVFPMTGSFLTKRLVAVGGIGTAYMSLCWKDYVKDFREIDMILWEFFINDPDITLHMGYDQSVKRFIQSIQEYSFSCPALIFVKFCKLNIFPGKEITCLVTKPAFRLQTQIVQENLKFFGITAINFQSIICNILKNSPTNQLSKSEYFISHHPSHLAHAQIGYSLTNHIRNQFLKFLDSGKSTRREMQSCYNDIIQKTIPESKCYTGILPNPDYQNVDLIYSLPKGWINGFKALKTSKWNPAFSPRFDVRGGYKASIEMASMSFLFNENQIPVQSNLHLMLSHQIGGGIVKVAVKTSTGIIIRSEMDCSKELFPASSISPIAQGISGSVEVQVYVPIGKCLLNAIIVECSNCSL